MLSCQTAGKRIFHDGSKHRIGHHETTLAATFKLMRQDSEAVGITLEMGDVVPELGRNFIFQSLSGTLAEESLDGFFSRMTKRRIAQIMCQAGCTHDGSDFLEERILQLRALLDDVTGDIVAQRHTHTCHFQAVSETVVYEDAARQRENLRLVLQPAESRREDESVVIALEFRAIVVAFGMFMLLSEALVRYELFPFHNPSVI